MNDLKNKWISLHVFAKISGFKYHYVNLYRERPALKKFLRAATMNSTQIYYCDEVLRILNNYKKRDFQDDLIALEQTLPHPQLTVAECM